MSSKEPKSASVDDKEKKSFRVDTDRAVRVKIRIRSLVGNAQSMAVAVALYPDNLRSSGTSRSGVSRLWRGPSKTAHASLDNTKPTS